MDESKDKKYGNKYLEVALMISYFLIPFVGLQRPLRHYLEVEELRLGYILLLMFIGGNIMTTLIFILNDKNVKVKLLWVTGLLIIIVAVNILLLITKG
jgi:hypothetical protein